jgi:hypothetical protein
VAMVRLMISELLPRPLPPRDRQVLPYQLTRNEGARITTGLLSRPRTTVMSARSALGTLELTSHRFEESRGRAG